MSLSAQEATILAFERRWPRHTDRKVVEIRARLGYSATRYYQLLERLIESPAALAADAQLVNRLIRQRDERRRRRFLQREAS